ncbi:hypothetical protein [Sphingomonas sp. IC4-52]|uniref:hypothetical protein n=1 Tax=Sphingomonas sp. IC4-52 TaxID=2887202 RepID=UPI001D0F6493|nr:hypothetical protein [Sphingomonas sp. IC4-52]MCC2981158.1 hypothetical protein [Sphingomonas sp. IC4-52]
MTATTPRPDLGSILSALAAASSRPRYAFLVLGLIAEAARADGQAGPWVQVRGEEGAERVSLRDWLARQLLPLAARDRRRAGLRAKVAARLGSNDPDRVEAALAEEALAIGKANVSRAVSDLVRAGLVRRHYAGRITDHCNRGGRRLAVYRVDPPVLNAIRSRPTLV